MLPKYIYTCYGCPNYYVDKGSKYPVKHCGIIDHWNNCECWKITKDKEEK